MTRALCPVVLAGCLGLLVACSGSPKPCPVTLEAGYTAALVEACGDAGSLEACKEYPALKAAHHAEQEDAGCRVK